MFTANRLPRWLITAVVVMDYSIYYTLYSLSAVIAAAVEI